MAVEAGVGPVGGVGDEAVFDGVVAARRIRCRRVHKRNVMHRLLVDPARFEIDGA